MNNEQEINRELSQWQVEVPDDPGFHSAVWREIAMRDASSARGRFQELSERLLRPRLGIPIGATALLATALLAAFHGQQSREKTWETLAQSYSQAIDPARHAERLYDAGSIK